ncbi:hypothetical protein ARALYDRAFT_321088 [Arabidopsis lyrata subsp. lyrata]|uniref:Uncharacterized protein n=1 Tax=Arabidopsis lyrata subsp. lyrata TaxID=81972 RepID=D7LGB9_ARALL|nr:hypothetical protein ARALYDRAFT_321088 [Arabidopsis lyrata subsp. lyrata]
MRITSNRCFYFSINSISNHHQSQAILREEIQKNPRPVVLSIKSMASSWRRSIGNVRSFIGNSMGGLRGGQSAASWVVAGTIAYFLWIKPAQDLKKEQVARAALAMSDPNQYVEKRKPIADPQVTGLIYGNKNRTDKPQD